MSQAPVLVRRSGRVVNFGLRDGSPFPDAFLQYLLPKLTYDHVEHLRGSARIMADGSRRNVLVSTRRLYDIVDAVRIQTGFGFVPKIAEALRRFGYTFDVEDLSPPRGADVYTPRWDLLERYNIQWRPRQRECMEVLMSAPGGIISAPPAFGKTQMIAYTGLLLPHAKIAVVAKRKDVAQGIERRMHEFLPNIGFFGDGHKRKGRVTVFIAKSMKKAPEDYDIVFVDECHEIGADSFSADLTRTFFFSRIFGLSATWDGRADGTSARLEYLFGPVIFHMTWPEAEQLGLIVPVEVRWLNINLTKNPCEKYSTDIARERHGIWCNEPRNAAIAAAARTHGPDDQTLILVRTVEHAVMLGRHLPEFSLCYDKMEPEDLLTYQSRGYLPPDFQPMTAQKRQEMRIQFEQKELKKVIATDVWSTGVSFEQLAVLIRADARASEIMDDQAPGRVVRIHNASGKQQGIVYDCWDMFDKRYLTKSQGRQRRYKQKGWTQLRERVLGAQIPR